jgi:transcriptional regulator GlxA family with amidase domain
MGGRNQSRRAVLQAGLASGVGLGLATAGLSSTAKAASSTAPKPLEREGATSVVILLYDGFTALDAVGPYEILSRVPGLTVVTVAKDAGPIRTDTGEIALVADQSIANVRRADVLLIAGGGEPGVVAAMADTAVLDWIRRIHQHTIWTTSVCTGALVLGATGLLRGRPATTHWASREFLESALGAVPTPGRFVETGKIITATGVSAGIDMALHLASRLADNEIAQALQLAIEYDPQPPFDTGAPDKATPDLERLALELLAEASAR